MNNDFIKEICQCDICKSSTYILINEEIDNLALKDSNENNSLIKKSQKFNLNISNTNTAEKTKQNHCDFFNELGDFFNELSEF